MRLRVRVVVPVAAGGAVAAAVAILVSFLAAPATAGDPVKPAAAFHQVPTRIPRPADNQDRLYVLDGWGGVHPVGASPLLATTAAWPTRDIAFSLALFPDGLGGYVMDGWGKLHPVGSAPAVDSGVYWPHWIGARQVVLAPWSSSSDPAGYILDADGNLHAFGGAPVVTVTDTLPGQDVMRAVALTANSTPRSVMGYTMDAYGGIHAFGGAPPVSGNARWPGDVARGMVLVPSRTSTAVEGYTLDDHGLLHPFGGAPAVEASATWTSDMVDSVVAWTAAPLDRPGGWVLDRHGGVHAFGSAPSIAPSQTWPGWDIARGIAGAGSGAGSTEKLVLEPETQADAWGAYYNQRDARWADAGVGPTTLPMWKVGCLLSDLAMVYTHFGFTSMTPATVAAHADWFDHRAEIYDSALDIPGHTTVVVSNPSQSWLAAQLRAGHPVIVGMTLYGGGTHFVTLTGMDGASDYWTDDPWEQNAMHVPFSGDWADRGPIYEAIAFI